MGSNPTPGIETRPLQAGTGTLRRETLSVPAELIALPPVAFALWLLVNAIGLLERWSLRERVGITLGGAVVAGPLALALLGLFGWLLLVAVLTVGLTAFAVARRAGRLPHRPGRGRPWALPRP